MEKLLKWLKYGCLVAVVASNLLGIVHAADIDDPYKKNSAPIQPVNYQIVVTK